MTLADEYRNQFRWRRWERIWGELPSMDGRLVLDLGCGVGDQAAALVARGAQAIGLGANEPLLEVARARGIPRAEFRKTDLRERLSLQIPHRVDGVWCSFTAAYFPRLDEVLSVWHEAMSPGGWIALTEIDDLFAHEPLDELAAATLNGYREVALAANRYDFRMGRRLRTFLEGAKFQVFANLELDDDELAFDGPAKPEVVDAWAARLARMKALQEFCGSTFSHVRGQLLGALAHPLHRCQARVHACLATRC